MARNGSISRTRDYDYWELKKREIYLRRYVDIVCNILLEL
jgi:hypothetical protein